MGLRHCQSNLQQRCDSQSLGRNMLTQCTKESEPGNVCLENVGYGWILGGLILH